VVGEAGIGAVCIGPGLGLDGGAGALLDAVIGHAGAAGLVLDADALTLLAPVRGAHPGSEPDPEPDPEPEPGRGTLFDPGGSHRSIVLTPHEGEFARLFPDLAAELAEPARAGPAASRIDAVRAAAARTGAVVLLKGPDTVICDPAGRSAIHSAAHGRAAPWLATAGAGDTLAGLITGLMARGHAPFDAACAAAWLHVAAARRVGPGLIADDLADALPGVLRDLEARGEADAPGDTQTPGDRSARDA